MPQILSFKFDLSISNAIINLFKVIFESLFKICDFMIDNIFDINYMFDKENIKNLCM